MIDIGFRISILILFVVILLLKIPSATLKRYLDDTEMYMNNVELYTTLPYASGVAMARGVLDSLMSATYFNASALRYYSIKRVYL